jgi:hypothetical protein
MWMLCFEEKVKPRRLSLQIAGTGLLVPFPYVPEARRRFDGSSEKIWPSRIMTTRWA